MMNSELERQRLDEAAEALDGLAPDPCSVRLVSGDSLTPEPVQWLWNGWLALGKLHIMAGQPGLGKTTIAMEIAATITSGGRWPDGASCPPGRIVIWTGEDDPADTLLPRLVAAGADRSRCHFVVGATDEEGRAAPFDPAQHMVALHAALRQLGDVRLLIVDPVVSAISGDSHKNAEVRKSLQPLVDLAADCGCAVLGISHFSKGGGTQDPTLRVTGSIAFSAVARVVLAVAKIKDEDGEESRIIVRAKSNISPDAGGFKYGVRQVEALPGIHASRIEWQGQVNGTARELLTEQSDEEAANQSDAAELLRQELVSDCWTPAAIATKAMADAGFSKKQTWQASKKLGVLRQKGGFESVWYWRLPGGANPDLPSKTPEDSTEDSEDSQSGDVESWESSGKTESSAKQSKCPKNKQFRPSTGPSQIDDIDFKEAYL